MHNNSVVNHLADLGVVFVENTHEIPANSLTVLSAHGVAPDVWAEAKDRGLRIVDATCPLVSKVQLEVLRQARAGRSVLVIGHRGHVEVEGLVGHFPVEEKGVVAIVETQHDASVVQVPDPDAVAWVSQTTLAVGEVQTIVNTLRERFTLLADPTSETICYATQSRQDAVRVIAARSDLVLVIGAPHSSNGNRLAEVARSRGTKTLLIEGPEDLNPQHFSGVETIGLTASASAPERLIQSTLAWLNQAFPDLEITETGTAEDVHFKLPAKLALFTGSDSN